MTGSRRKSQKPRVRKAPALSPRYRAALRALKMQAKAVQGALPGSPGRKPGGALAQAQALMARHNREVNRIMSCVALAAEHDRTLTIPALTERKLAEILGPSERRA